ncbi:TylF/MycF/NovP-related O-methyltransferase [Rubrobacter indicoceani]|uniref:TylF/MycF/NovP-related O-methyltransferase n=1 Tax=Rubrobacter indicoceani TaxID=2051957 RepID=UPI000E5A71A7|nr:TylF/MycF/NovP-related O-methyltransferase [Rubrobacter indicoceani]
MPHYENSVAVRVRALRAYLNVKIEVGRAGPSAPRAVLKPASNDATSLYLDLLERSLLGLIERDGESMGGREFDLGRRLRGRDWPQSAYTMIGQKRLRSIRRCIRTVIREDVPGDLIETGVWRGGASIYAKACLKAFGDEKRNVWVADSFTGLPEPNPEKYPADAGDEHHTYEQLAISLETVRDNFSRFDLLDERVRFLKGWFSETLPTAPIERLAVARLDGDLYESTMDALTALYPKLSPGFLIVDDYGGLAPCREAVEDYRSAHSVTGPVEKIDWTGVLWRKAR